MPIKNIEDIAKRLHVSVEDVQSALQSEEEVTLEMPEVVSFTKTEFEEREANQEAERQRQKDIDRQAGLEYGIKSFAKEKGFDIDAKTPDALFAAMQQKAGAGAGDPSEREKQLEADLNQMTMNFQSEQEKATGLEQQLGQIKTEATISGALNLGSIDSGNLLLPKSDIDTLFKTKNTIKQTENGLVLMNPDGTIKKNDKTLAPISVTEAYQSYVESNFVKKPSGGSGGDDDPGGSGGASYDDFVKEMSDAGHREGSERFNQELIKRQKDGTLKI